METFWTIVVFIGVLALVALRHWGVNHFHKRAQEKNKTEGYKPFRW